MTRLIPPSFQHGNRVGWLSLLLLCLVLTAGCSRTRIAYNFSDWFLLHRIDHYFDLTHEQERFLSARVSALQAWHRQHELPRLVAALRELERRYQDGLSAGDVDWVWAQQSAFWQRLIARGLPDFAEFLTTLQPEQIRHLQNRFQNGGGWLVKQAALDETELARDHGEWLREVLEEWYGGLDADQAASLPGELRADAGWVKLRLANRHRFQQNFLELVQAGGSAEIFHQRLGQWLQHPETRWLPGFEERLEARRRQWQRWMVRVDAMMSPAQRRHALERIRGYRLDFQTLVEEG